MEGLPWQVGSSLTLTSLALPDWRKNWAKSRIQWTSWRSLAIKSVYSEDDFLHGWRGGGRACRTGVPSHPVSLRSLLLTVCLLPCKCQWWERRTDVLPCFTKAYNLLMLLYHWLLQSSLPRTASCYLSAAVQTSCQNVSRHFDANMTQGDSWNKAYRFIWGFYIVFLWR